MLTFFGDRDLFLVIYCMLLADGRFNIIPLGGKHVVPWDPAVHKDHIEVAKIICIIVKLFPLNFV